MLRDVVGLARKGELVHYDFSFKPGKLNTDSFKPQEGWYNSRTDLPAFHDLAKMALPDAVTRNGKSMVRDPTCTINGYQLKYTRNVVNYFLTPTFTWSPRVGVCTRFVEPGGDAVAFVSLNLMYWRNPLSIHFRTTANGELLAQLPVQVYKQDWRSEGFGRGSPNATGKTLFVPENEARRSYGIMLTRAEDEKKNRLFSALHAAAVLGFQPLDKVKDWILDWPDPMANAKWPETATPNGKRAVQVMRDYYGGKRSRYSGLAGAGSSIVHKFEISERNKMTRHKNVFHYDGQLGVDMDIFVATPWNTQPEIGKYGHKAHPYGRMTGYDKRFFPQRFR